MAKQIYREKSLNYISSPEQLNDYLKVTKPAVWAILAAVVALLVGLLIWSAFARIDSYAVGLADVDDGVMVFYIEDATAVANIKEGMVINAGGIENPITGIGSDDDGGVFALANTSMEDGMYSATISYKQTQVLSLLFGD